ncbi:MAG: GGDEF domain-containing protein [Bacillota bacterium]|nr:GGDEF domain-containing protein [Bacillota bacterium]
MINDKNKRLTIGFFVGGRNSSYSDLLCRGAIETAEENDVNLVIFPGRALKPELYSDYMFRYEYQFNVIYDYASSKNLDALILSSGMLNSYTSSEAYSEFCSRYKPLPMVSIASPVEGLPCVLIDNSYGLKQGIHHLIQIHNRRRIAFICGPEKNGEADERYNAYVTTLRENGIPFDPDLVCPGDFTRFSAKYAIRLLKDIRKTKFDAVVAANDDMAMAALEELISRNISVPEDVSVIGFDDFPETSYSIPSLTTVHQPIYEQARLAVNMALDLLNGKPVNNEDLTTQLVIRESCGCNSNAVKTFSITESTSVTGVNPDILSIINNFTEANYKNISSGVFCENGIRNFIQKLFNYISNEKFDDSCINQFVLEFKASINMSEINDTNIMLIQNLVTVLRKNVTSFSMSDCTLTSIEELFSLLQKLISDLIVKYYANHLVSHHYNIQYLRMLLNRMIYSIHKNEEQLNPIKIYLKKLGLESCYIFLYDYELTHIKGDEWVNPEFFNLVMGYDKSGIFDINKINTRICCSDVLNADLIPEDRRYTLFINPLFFLEEQIGVIICESNLNDYHIFDTLVVELSCAIKLSSLAKANEELENQLIDSVIELEHYNQVLDSLSQTDELTNLYNRRGFLNLAAQSLELARNMGKTGHLFFADMDGLKKINDNYGHNEGDSALIAVAEILRKTFRKSNIIARLGGDEFTVFSFDTSNKLIPTIQSKLNKYIDEYNHSSGKPYKISVSIGVVPFSFEDNVTIESLMRQADRLLYKQKNLKKKSR